MDKFDRELQREILKVCIEAYPRTVDELGNDYVSEITMSAPLDKLLANLFYLSGHGLITFPRMGSNLDDQLAFSILDMSSVTCKGIDFMLNDGGLSAILNVQTIKFHREAVVVLEDLIAISNMDVEQKEKAKSTLGELSTEALKTVVQAATNAGLSKLLGQ